MGSAGGLSCEERVKVAKGRRRATDETSIDLSAVAVVLWLYAGAMLLIGVVFMGVPLIGAPIVIGAVSVAIGAYLYRRRKGWASILLLVGGIVVGGICGVLGEGVSHVEGERENYAAAFILGVILFGFLPILAGLGLAIGRLLDVIWRVRHESSVPIE